MVYYAKWKKTDKDKYSIVSLICEILKKNKLVNIKNIIKISKIIKNIQKYQNIKNISKRNQLIEIENKLVLTSGEWRKGNIGVRKWEIQIIGYKIGSRM